MQNYLDYLNHIMTHGVDKKDRTGTGTRSVFGYQMRWDLAKGFPLVTTKQVFTRGIIAELIWFLSGSTNVKPLQEQGVKIWDAWADASGDLGPVYGYQWRSWPTYKISYREDQVVHADNSTTYFDTKANVGKIDQLAEVIESLTTNPESRRHIVTAWNPAMVDEMALPPCHCLFQFNTRPLTLQERKAWLIKQEGDAPVVIHPLNEQYLDDKGVPRYRLDCQLYQRSADSFLGVPFNIASYALLTMMVAQQVGMEPGDFIWTGGDCHIYSNHFEQVQEQLTRSPRALPTMKIKKAPSIFEYSLDDFELIDYVCDGQLKAPVAV